jgi:hypothetical protein
MMKTLSVERSATTAVVGPIKAPTTPDRKDGAPTKRRPIADQADDSPDNFEMGMSLGLGDSSPVGISVGGGPRNDPVLSKYAAAQYQMTVKRSGHPPNREIEIPAS